ncbi:MAG: hypothetical protein ACRCXK_06315, partial [Wohlfahrtiimonas sp.]
MSNETVWISSARRNHDYEWLGYYLSTEKNNPRTLMQYKAENYLEREAKLKPEYDKELDNYIDLTRKNRSREKLALEDHPNHVYKMPEEKWECNKSIFMAHAGFTFVNEATAKILKQHNLGDSQLIKVKAYDAVTDEPIKDACSLYLLHIAEAYECCDVEQSISVRKIQGFSNEIEYGDGLEYRDDGYIINASVLELGLDLWTDSRLDKSMFISDRLKTALDEAGLAKD